MRIQSVLEPDALKLIKSIKVTFVGNVSLVDHVIGFPNFKQALFIFQILKQSLHTINIFQSTLLFIMKIS